MLTQGDAINALTAKIIAVAIDIHRALGPGLLETAYLECLTHDLSAAALRIEREKRLPLVYRRVVLDCAYRVDLIVEEQVVVEVKAVDAIAPVHARQLQTYVKLAECRVGLLLNFGASTLRDGIRRVVNGFPDPPARDQDVSD